MRERITRAWGKYGIEKAWQDYLSAERAQIIFTIAGTIVAALGIPLFTFYGGFPEYKAFSVISLALIWSSLSQYSSYRVLSSYRDGIERDEATRCLWKRRGWILGWLWPWPLMLGVVMLWITNPDNKLHLISVALALACGSSALKLNFTTKTSTCSHCTRRHP